MQLLKEPGAKVYMVDREPFFGGISYSANLCGFYVDKGVHMFDSIPKELAQNVSEIMQGHVRTIHFVSVSAFNGVLTDGFSLPDLSSLPAGTRERITQELKALAATADSAPPATNLLELLESRYGKTAGGIFANIFKNIYNIEAVQAQPDAISRTSLGRLKFLDDEQMLELKRADPFLDSVLAARRKAVGEIDDLVSIYPDTGEAMRGWCVRAEKWLEAKGVTMCLGQAIEAIQVAGNKARIQTDKQSIEADKIVWTNDNTQALSTLLGFEFNTLSHVSATPMLFATLVTKASDIKDFTYLQNFGPHGITYRTASAGIYSNQIDADGNSFITCECPAPIDSERWKDSAELHSVIWQECKDLSIVSSDAELVRHSVLRLPVTFKLSKIGHDDRIREFQDEVQKRAPDVIFRDVKPFFRRDIYLDSLKIADLVAR